MDRSLLWAGMFALALLSFLPKPSAFAQASAKKIAVTKTSLHLGSSEIQADVFEQEPRKPRPVILVLHGAGGMLFDGPEMRRVARDFAEAGNAVYLLHYFERTGTLFARDATMQKNFDLWLETVRAAIPAIQKSRNDDKPVGLYGYSLGGFLVLAAASDNPRVAAVVEHAGGVWNGRMNRIGRMPPVLMIHGKRDARVPFEKYAEPLLAVLRKRAARVETHFFADEGHGFTQAAMVQVRADAGRFFRRNLPPRE